MTETAFIIDIDINLLFRQDGAVHLPYLTKLLLSFENERDAQAYIIGTLKSKMDELNGENTDEIDLIERNLAFIEFFSTKIAWTSSDESKEEESQTLQDPDELSESIIDDIISDTDTLSTLDVKILEPLLLYLPVNNQTFQNYKKLLTYYLNKLSESGYNESEIRKLHEINNEQNFLLWFDDPEFDPLVKKAYIYKTPYALVAKSIFNGLNDNAQKRALTDINYFQLGNYLIDEFEKKARYYLQKYCIDNVSASLLHNLHIAFMVTADHLSGAQHRFIYQTLAQGLLFYKPFDTIFLGGDRLDEYLRLMRDRLQLFLRKDIGNEISNDIADLSEDQNLVFKVLSPAFPKFQNQGREYFKQTSTNREDIENIYFNDNPSFFCNETKAFNYVDLINNTNTLCAKINRSGCDNKAKEAYKKITPAFHKLKDVSKTEREFVKLFSFAATILYFEKNQNGCDAIPLTNEEVFISLFNKIDQVINIGRPLLVFKLLEFSGLLENEQSFTVHLSAHQHSLKRGKRDLVKACIEKHQNNTLLIKTAISYLSGYKDTDNILTLLHQLPRQEERSFSPDSKLSKIRELTDQSENTASCFCFFRKRFKFNTAEIIDALLHLSQDTIDDENLLGLIKNVIKEREAISYATGRSKHSIAFFEEIKGILNASESPESIPSISAS